MKIDNRKDILLLLLYSPGMHESFNEAISGKTRLVKMVFLFWKEHWKDFRRAFNLTEDRFYKFYSWAYGPYSSEVYDDLSFFILKGFISAVESNKDPMPQSAAEWAHWLASSSGGEEEGYDEYVEEIYSLTNKGKKFAKELYSGLNKHQTHALKEFKKTLQQAPLRSILQYVYEKYPEFTDRSVIRDEVLG